MEDRLKEIEIENFVWIIYIGIIFLSYFANNLEKNFIIYNDENSKKEYQKIMIFIFSVLLIIYYYFAKESYIDILELNNNDTNKKRTLTYASFIGSFLILISGIIFLGIVIIDKDIETEIAFN